MPSRKKAKAASPRNLAILGIVALALFVLGETIYLTCTDGGTLTLARFGLVNPARTTQIVGRQLHRALDAMSVPSDSITSKVAGGRPSVHWRVGLKPEASATQIHAAIAQALEESHAHVISGRERAGADGAFVVTLLVGIGSHATHEIRLVHAARPRDAGAAPAAGRIALVLFGFGDDEAAARATFGLPAPFAVAITPGGRTSAAQFKLARDNQREIVLHLPLEPINYPQINPGEGTLLVTMSAAQIGGKVRRYLEQSDGAVAVSNHMGSLATQDMTVMTAIFKELKREKLPFVHVLPAPGAVCRSLASTMGVAYDAPDAVLDAETLGESSKALDAAWKTLRARALDERQLMVWVRSTPLSRKWLTRIQNPTQLGDVRLVPLTSVLRRPVEL